MIPCGRASAVLALALAISLGAAACARAAAPRSSVEALFESLLGMDVGVVEVIDSAADFARPDVVVCAPDGAPVILLSEVPDDGVPALLDLIESSGFRRCAPRGGEVDTGGESPL